MKDMSYVGLPEVNAGTYIKSTRTKDGCFTLTGDKGYKTALSGHGTSAGDFYFEVVVLAPKMPLPFIGV